MAINVIAWQCEYCNELKRSHLIATRHEKACLKNPNARNCILCINRTEEKEGRKRSICKIDGKLCSIARSADCENFERIEGK